MYIEKERNTCLQDQIFASRYIWVTFGNQLEKIEDVDSLVNYGLAMMLPLLVIFSWLYHD